MTHKTISKISVISCIMVIVLFFGAMPLGCYAEDNSYDKRTVVVEYSDSPGINSKLSLLIHENNVYLCAEEIAKAFGMEYHVDNKKASLYIKDYENASYKLTQFYIGSKKVDHLILSNIVEYEAPYDCLLFDDAVWIPFEYSLLLMDSGYTILEDTILIDKPRDTILSIFNNVSKNSSRYSFSYQDDFGYSDSGVVITGGTNHLVNVFNGLLDFDGTAWSEMFRGIAKLEMFPTEIPSGYDVKYGTELTTLLCTCSDSELKAEQKKITKIQKILSPTGKLGKFISKKGDKYDAEIGAAYESLKECIKECYPNDTVTVSNAKNVLDDLLDKSNSFSKSSTGISNIQNAFTGVMSYLDVALTVAECVGYVEEFRNRDEFSLAALNEYLNTDNNLSPTFSLSLQSNLALLQSDPVLYSSERILISKIPSWIGKGLSITEGLAAEPTLLAWNLASTFIPFISDGLSSADNYELSLYGIWLSSSSFNTYLEQKNRILSSNNSLNSQEFYKLSKICYLNLKSCMVTRSAAIGSLEINKLTIPDAVNQLEREQNEINDDIADLLVMLKTATPTNKNYEYGFLPEDSTKYISQYDSKNLLKKVNEMQEYESGDEDMAEESSMESDCSLLGLWDNYDTSESMAENLSLNFIDGRDISAIVGGREIYSGNYSVNGKSFLADLKLDEYYNNATASWDIDERILHLVGTKNGNRYLNVYISYNSYDDMYGPFTLSLKEDAPDSFTQKTENYRELANEVGYPEKENGIELINSICDESNLKVSMVIANESFTNKNSNIFGRYIIANGVNEVIDVEVHPGIDNQPYVTRIQIYDLYPYTLCGIHVGMDKESALSKMNKQGFDYYWNDEINYEYKIDQYRVLTICFSGEEYGNIVSNISFTDDCPYSEEHEKN